MVANMLSSFQKDKYLRTISLDEVKEEGQEKLLASSVLIVGVGGLGNSVLTQLVALGIGHIGIVDCDCINISNLPRQMLYDEKDVGKKKVQVAYEKVKDKNQDVKITTYDVWLDKNNIEGIIKDYDLVVDATDNFETKFLISDTCYKVQKPYVHGGVSKFDGQVFSYLPKLSPRFSELFDVVPQDKDLENDKGVFPSAPLVIASFMVQEVSKIILGLPNVLFDSMLVINLKTLSVKRVRFKN